jgi:cytochrome c556
MTRSMKIGGFIAAAAFAWGLGTAIVAAQDKEAVAKDRREFMKQQGAAMGGVKAFLDGNADAAKAADSATQLAKLAKTIPDKFPKGSGMAELPAGTTGAKPIIWTDWNKFLENQKALAAEADKLAEAAKGGDKAKIQEQFGATGKACGDCHNTFREKLS